MKMALDISQKKKGISFYDYKLNRHIVVDSGFYREGRPQTKDKREESTLGGGFDPPPPPEGGRLRN